ncbi:BON domain-containing protein [Vogesella sp. LIG4]|uniref:BON domain-containing protein n=1 Tax=Vogesella sp. LIG4 TaxID=1192162 RepID=UPI00081F9BAE|nr:BON domain-containing protein [Vogesella sp. LIG4]SCK21507.1 Predicted periplasmic or secreted lipoprotein [Vogesella sp. LIG4]
MKKLIRLSAAAVLFASSLMAVAGEAEDLKLASDVKAAIDSSDTLKAFNLKVSAKDGNVTIEGTVDQGLQMADVGMAAEKVPGVKFVFNNIMPKQQ